MVQSVWSSVGVLLGHRQRHGAEQSQQQAAELDVKANARTKTLQQKVAVTHQSVGRQPP